MFGRRSSVQVSRRRARVPAATLLLLMLLGALLVAPAHAEPISLAAQQYSKTTRDGWHLTLSIDNERVNSRPIKYDQSQEKES